MNHQPTSSLSPRLIAVLGCTGTVGAEVLQLLAHKTISVRGILRHSNRSVPVSVQNQPTCVAYVAADHTSVEQLARAFMGAHSLFLSMGTGPEQVQIESNAIKAASLAGVRRVVKMSAPVIAAPASVEVAKWHRTIEEKLSESGLESCFLRPYSFMQNWLRNSETIRQFGTIIGSAGSAPRNYIDVRDVAEIAVRLLLSEEPLTSSAISISGPEVITNQEMAERLSSVTGRAIHYENLSRDDHYQLLVKRAQLPEWLAQHIVELEELAVKIQERLASTVQDFLGRFPRTMDEFLQEQRMMFMPLLAEASLDVLYRQGSTLTVDKNDTGPSKAI
jgi:uncharacterized protein YbjT (DUF2867 family)